MVNMYWSHLMVSKHWTGKCAVCGRTNSYFVRATYEGAPDGGVPVHWDCLNRFWKQLEDEQWRKDFDQAWREETSRSG
jgi:hypothetical protein